MGASVYIRNDGPDTVEVLIGKNSSVLLEAGREFRVNTSVAVSFNALKPLTREELLMHNGAEPTERLRHAED